MSILQTGPDGYAISACDLELDFLIDNDVNDPEPDDPVEWPAWTDASTWELGPEYFVPPPAPEPEPEYEPTPEDWADFHAWYRERDAINQERDDAIRESRYLEQLEAAALFTDADLMAAGLPVG